MKYKTKIPEKENILTLDIVISLIKKNLIINNKLSPYFSRLNHIVSERKLENLIDNIYYHTNFILVPIKFGGRVNLLLNNVTENKNCKCGEIITKLKIREGKVVGLNDYCSSSCANRYTNYKRGHEFYKKVSKKVHETMRKNGSYKPFPVEVWSESARKKRKETNIKKYGFENAGVLGAYSSKIGEKYIRNYLKINDISEDRCYFKNGGINGNEYYRMAFSEYHNKYIYFSYDLVVLNENKKNIILVIEYNGTWHYRLKDKIDRGYNPATPYKNSKTIKETYDFDIIKLNTIRKICDNILIYWEDNDTLIKYNGIEL